MELPVDDHRAASTFDSVRRTPLGELRRRYWMQIAAVGELDDKSIKPMRLPGENLVAHWGLT